MLSDVRVIDLTGTLPGPYCTLLLAHFGAEVIKVERPGMGDTMRNMDPWLYENLNRGKKSVVLDLKTEEGSEALRLLVEKADVLVEGFRPGVVERFGADYDSLKRINSKIVYCSISGFGQDSPYRDRPGHDIDYMAISGALAMTGRVEEDPPEGHVQNIPVSDFAGGLFAANAILAALAREEKRSVYIDVSMTDIVLSWAALKSGYYFADPLPREPTVEAHYGVFRTKDGRHVALGVIEDHFWQRLCRYLGWDDFLEDPELATYEGRNQHAEHILPRLQAAIADRTKRELVEDLVSLGVPCSPVQDWSEVAEDPHVRHRGLLSRRTDTNDQEYACIEIPYEYRNFESPRLEHAPALGEHTTEIIGPLRERGRGRDRNIETAQERIESPSGPTREPGAGNGPDVADPLLMRYGGEVRLSGIRCGTCGHVSFPVRPVCPNCFGTEVEGAPIGAKATLLSHTISHVAPDGFEAPLVQAWVRVDEGPELFSLLSCTAEQAASLSSEQRLELELFTERNGVQGWGYRPIFREDTESG